MWPLLLLLTTASADNLLVGDRIRIHYNSYGTWNSSEYGRGFDMVQADGDWRDLSMAGTPWQNIAFEWDQSGSSHEYRGNYAYDGADWTTESTVDASEGDRNEIIHQYAMGNLEVIKTESWDDADQIMSISFRVTNRGSSDATNLRINHAVDPDQDSWSLGTASTTNDVRSDGRYAETIGVRSGWTFSYGTCSGADELGITGWDRDADATLSDPDGSEADDTLHWRHTVETIAPGETIEASFVATWGENADEAEANYDDNWMVMCGLCDVDEDGYEGVLCGGDDCDDDDDEVNPGATEYCDDIDNDCDGVIDEADAVDAGTWYTDADDDGFGDADSATLACSALEGTVADSTDCDDGRDDVSPDSDEVCDEVDNDCDGTIDEDDATDARTWYTDADDDGFGDAATATVACWSSDGAIEDGSDCDDDREDIYPGAEEFCDGADNDCDGIVDEGAVDAGTWYADSDGDGFGDSDAAITSCSAPDGHVTDASDCDDDNAAAHPEAEEVCDEADNDCDGDVDEDATDASDFVADMDGDGYADTSAMLSGCDAPEGYIDADSSMGEDCDDDDASVHPGAVETWYDDIDADCDGASDWDADLDGYDLIDEGDTGAPLEEADCDDEDPDSHPDAEDIPDDGIDQDCDGLDTTSEDTGDLPDDTGDVSDDTGDVSDDTGDTGDTGDDTGRTAGETDQDDDDDPDEADGDAADGKADCSCTTAPGPGSALLGLLLLGAVIRRRREGAA
jgi:MYXO-CTERM domain-containing protein